MYQVMLVDDEILVRERISKRIPWESLGYRLAAVCENGKEAMEVLKEREIDLVLTDICMPYIDGLELAKFIYNEKKSTKVVILSGYDEFSYAKEALKYQALSYVLKPVTADELMRTLSEAKERLDERKVQEQAASAYLDGLEVLKEQLLLQLVLGNVTTETLQDKCAEYGIAFEGESYLAVAVHIREKTSESCLLQIAALAKSVSGNVLAFVGTEEKQLILLIRQCNNRQIMEEARMVCGELLVYAEKEFGYHIGFLIGNCVSDLADICVSYQNALKLKEFLYLGHGEFLLEWEFFLKHKWDIIRWLKTIQDRRQRIVLAVKSNLKEEVRKELEGFQQECRECWISKSKAVVALQGMIFAMISSVNQIELEEDEELFLKGQESIIALPQCIDLSEMTEEAVRFFQEAADILESNRGSYGERQAMMAIDYIEKHYADPELSLSGLCQELAISVSYFSAAFKEYAGKTFVEALTEQRMKKARELLESETLKMYEIAEKCGYRDAGYFGVAYKKFYGMTPREHVKQIRKGKER